MVSPDYNRTVYVGVYNTLMGVAMAVGPLLGGFAAEVVGLRPVFLASGMLRALGLLVFFKTVTDISGRKMSFRDLIPTRSA